MALIAIVCVLIGLVAFNVIRERFYPYLLYAISLAILLQITLASPGLVGTDIHLEYYFAVISGENGWDTSIPYLNNSSFALTIIAPWINKIFHIPLIWVFKIVFPMMFASVPVLLYYVFKEWITDKQAFLAAFFFVSVPTYFMELTGIAREQVAEVFLALTLFLIVVSKMRLRYKLPAVIASSLMVIVCHYSLGPIIMFILAVGFVLQLVLRTDIRFPAWAFGIATLVLIVCSVAYYHNIAEGKPLRYMTAIVPVETQKIWLFEIGPMYPPFPPDEILYPPGSDTIPSSVPYFENHEVVVKAAIGLDFMQTSTWGKVFRVFQFITQIMVVIGFFVFWKLKKKGYYVLAASCGLLLALCVFVPGISAILNATRFYHLTLFLLAPAFVVGSQLVFKDLRIVVLCVMIPYFLFTSGFMYEATRSTEITRLDMPYSVALSDHRFDLGASPTENDVIVREWIEENNPEVLYADYYGVLFLQETLGTKKIYRLPEDWTRLRAWDIRELGIPKGSYVFLRERGTAVFWAGIGLRVQYPYNEIHLDKLGDRVYNAGNAEVRLVN